MPSPKLLSLLLLVLFTVACGDDDMTPDAGDGGMVPDGGEPPVCAVPMLGFGIDRIGSIPGVERRTFVELTNRDYLCGDLEVTFSSSDEGVVSAPAPVTIPLERSRADVVITAVAVGTATVTASFTAGDTTQTATLEVIVVDPALPACDGTASGSVAAGGSVEVTSGSLTGSSVGLPEGAAADTLWHADGFDVDIACASDQLPDGFAALGPAVSFAPGHQRFMRDIPFALPIQTALLPEGAHRGHVEVSYTGPGVTEPRIVPVAIVQIDSGGGLVRFEAPRLGTYQAVVRTTAGATRMREHTFRGILGASMGGVGTGVIGFRNPELFDFVAPLGAAWDWVYLLHYIRTQHLGGFCTEDERVADPTACTVASATRNPEPMWISEVSQDFEHWWYDETIGGLGHGASFDREQYMSIFQDLSMMYGNPNTDAAAGPAEPNVMPPGVPDSERFRPAAERCADPVIIPPYDGTAGTGYFDDEYNPDGTYQAIAFCDGSEVRYPDGSRNLGVWDPMGPNDFPIGVGLAIDIDGDGIRDPGEPVVRNSWETYDDCGLDRECNADEAGYDAVTNPDPAGDDYDPQYNPAGTEGNFLRDGDPCDATGGEAFVDFGLDGLLGTEQLADGGFDHGEGNGCWDRARGATRMIERGPKHLVLGADETAMRDIDVFGDGGIRDLFMAGVAANHTFAAFPARGFPLRLHNGHAPFHLDGRPNDDSMFVFTQIRWEETGKNVLVRYGNPDTTPGRLEAGDGAHVGTIEQAVNRILSPMAWMSTRWPGGDRRRVEDRLCREGAAGCDNPNQILFDFTAPSTGRTGPVSIILPPGYYEPENAELTYPVAYFLHGYGMEPQDLIDVAVLIWNFNIAATIPEAQRFQKMIFVFPDGRCRGNECVKGTFFTDAPESTPEGAQMETFMLDLVDYVDATYRTRAPEMHPVVD